MGEVERRLEGQIVFTVLGRPNYGFDVFTIDLPHDLNGVKSVKLKDKRLTDGRSINYNAQFVGAEDAKLLFTPHQNPAFTKSELDVGEADEGSETVVFISERSGNARIHLSGAAKAEKDNSLKRFSTGEFKAATGFFFDRPFVRNGRAFFVSNREKPGQERDILSWSAVYSTCLKTGATIRLTPHGVADYSPSISPCGKWIMVASYGATRDWGVMDIQDLKTDLYVFKAEDGSGRKMVAELGGWPTWADENTVYFHKRGEDGWWSIYRLNLDGSVEPERITPPSLHVFTPCASQTGKWIAVATRRPESKYRHIEIFDLESKSFVPVTASINPEIHHYNPFLSTDSLKLGFHRFRGEDAEEGDTVVPFLERIESPISTLLLQRVNGFFPAFSADGSLIAFHPDFSPQGGVHVVRSDGTLKRWKVFKGFAFAVSWNGKQNGLLYASMGQIFSSEKTTIHIISIRFNPEELGEESEVKSEVKLLTKEGTGNNAFPCSSPDGKQLVFRSGRSGHKNLYIMDAEEGEEGGIRTLTEGPWIDTMPCWSPDGQWIAFNSNRDNPKQAIHFSAYLVHPDGTGLHKVMGIEREMINHVCFSPDSKSLLFSANFDSVSAEPISVPNHFQPHGELYLSALDGSDVQRLTFNAYEDGTPAWHKGSSDLDIDWNKAAGEKLKGEFIESLWLENQGPDKH